jgi:Protein of unknown function (DUF4232)
VSADLGDPSMDPQEPQEPQHPKHPQHPQAGQAGQAADSSRPHDRPHDQPHSQDHDQDHDQPHDLGERLPDLGPVEALLLPDVEALPIPSGSFERIRRRATRRRRVRAVTGGGLAVAAVVGGLYLLGVPGSPGSTAPPVTATYGGIGPVTSASPPSSGPPSTAPSPSATVGSAPEPSQSSSPSASATAGPSATPSTPTTSTPTSPSAVATCPTSQLTAALGGSDAGAGNLYRYLVLTNNGSTPCALEGFPGLSLLDDQGTQLGAAATFDHSFSYARVVLRPGASASDTIHTLNAGATSCTGTSNSLRIYPPGNRASLVIPGQVMLCGGQLSVSPFTSGSTGNPPS